MKDTIYRQDAIDAMYKIVERNLDLGVCEDVLAENPHIDVIVDELENLPSAEPNDKLKKIADLVDGTIDHFDLDDAMDLLYQIKDVCGKENG